jgi:hypothetical protein
VREWVNRSGQSTYIRYLINHPDRSLLDPVRYFGNLINGSNVEYRYPVYPNQPVPDLVLAGDRKFYLRSLPALLAITLLFFTGMYLYWTGREREHPAWLALTILGAAIPPMAFIIWNGNPLEIERHASQLGQQFRLIGWVCLMLLVDRFASHNLKT